MPLPDNEPDPRAWAGEAQGGYVPGDLSLAEEVEALIEDGKTFLEAELAFQKTRAAFVAHQAKSAAILGAVAGICAVLALIGLTVGLIIALTPIVTAWGATALVAGGLLLAGALTASAAAKRWRRLNSALKPDRKERP